MAQAHNYRCTHRHCRRRWRLRKPLEAYVRAPCLDADSRCKACHKGYLAPTNAELRRKYAREQTCHCGLPPWPHREGSTPLCPSHPDWEPA